MKDGTGMGLFIHLGLNGWALHGLSECLAKLGRADESANAMARYRKAFAQSDVTIPGSCYCKTKTAAEG